MFDRTAPRTDDPTAPQPPERVMRITPLDMRQQRFKTAVRGYDKTEVVAFLTEAADDYEHAIQRITEPGQEPAEAVMGSRFPRASYTTIEEFEARGC